MQDPRTMRDARILLSCARFVVHFACEGGIGTALNGDRLVLRIPRILK